MSFANPTALRIGMTGALAGKRYRVAGRVVLGMEDAGETYYWNEFNLVNDQGEGATLAYEESEDGGQWRLFTFFEPEYPITAQDAATKRIGDRINLEGTEVRVTLVDESRVYHIEGEAPEGVEVGDVAHYFNAESRNTMQVVSWTGDEVECYRGTNLAPSMVALVFNLPRESSASRRALSASLFNTGGHGESGTEKYDRLRSFVAKAAAFVLIAAIALAGYSLWARKRQTRGRKTPAPASPLVVGTSGKLDGKDYRIRSHALVEIAEVGHVFDRHEYRLVDLDDADALLIFGLKPGAKDWTLFRPLQPLEPLAPERAAALRVGDMVNVDGVIAPVKELFQSTISGSDGEAPRDARVGEPCFGFIGWTNSTVLLVRWANNRIEFHRGRSLSQKAVSGTFSKK